MAVHRHTENRLWR